ncbi:hypothetical protein LCGC14_2563600, partial [marine sediment metagenome]
NFGGIARDNPGVLQQMFPFLKDEDIKGFRDVLPTIEQLQEKIERPGLTPEAAGGELPPEVASALSEFARAKTVGAKPAEVALEPKRVVAAGEIPQEDVTAGLRREVTGLTPGGEAQDAFRLEVFNSATEAINELGLDEKKAATLRSALPAAFFDEDARLAHQRRLEITNLQITAQTIDRANERLDAFRMGVASRWVNKTNVGLPETWQLFLYSKDANDRAKLLQSRAAVPENESDISLLEVADAFTRAKDADKIIEQAAASRQIPILIERIEKRDRDGKYLLERSVRVALVEQLNFTYMEASALSEGRLPFRKAEIPSPNEFPFTSIRTGFGKNKALKILDEGGQEIEQSPERLQELREEEEAGARRESVESREEGVGQLNFETVDASQLSPITRRNLIRIMNGEGTFEELQAFDPAGAQTILDARRGR